MNEKINKDYTHGKDEKYISYLKKSNTNFLSKKQKILTKQIKNSQKNKKSKINKNLLITNKKSNVSQKINKSRDIKIDKEKKKTCDYMDNIQNKNKSREKKIRNFLIEISNKKNLRLRKKQYEILNILGKIIKKIKNKSSTNTGNFNNCVESYDSNDCNSENIYINHEYSKTIENKALNEILFTTGFQERTNYKSNQTNSYKNNNLSQKIYSSDKNFSKSFVSLPVGIYNNIGTITFLNEKTFTSPNKIINNIEYISPEKNSEARKITRSIIKTEKTKFVPRDTDSKTKETTEKKEKTIIEINNNQNDSKKTMIKNNEIKITTQNKIVDVPEVNIIYNADKAIIVKQFKTKEHQTIVIYIDNKEKNKINQIYDINGNKINKKRNYIKSTLNNKNINIKINNNINNDIKKKLFTVDDKFEIIKKTELKKLSRSSSGKLNNSRNKNYKNMKTDLSQSKKTKKKIQGNDIILIPKKKVIKNNIFKLANNNEFGILNKNNKNNISKKFNFGFFKKNKINFDMPEDIIDINGLQKEECLSKEKRKKINGSDNNIALDNTKQLIKPKISNLHNENKTQNSNEEIATKRSTNSKQKEKMNKLAEFIYKLNDSCQKLNNKYYEDNLITEEFSKNFTINNDYAKNKCTTEAEEVESSFEIVDENYNRMQADKQKEIGEGKFNDLINNCKNRIEKNESSNSNLIKETVKLEKKRENFECVNNNYLLPKISDDNDLIFFSFEENNKVSENESLNNNSDKRNSIKKISTNTQNIQQLNEKIISIDNNIINTQILLNSNISSSEIDDSNISGSEHGLNMSEFNKKKKNCNRIFLLKSLIDEKGKLSIRDKIQTLQNKFFVPLKKYEEGFELNKINPFNVD